MKKYIGLLCYHKSFSLGEVYGIVVEEIDNERYRVEWFGNEWLTTSTEDPQTLKNILVTNSDWNDASR